MAENTEIAPIIKHQVPRLIDLINDTELRIKQDDLNIILNTPVPQQWVKQHPMAKVKIPKIDAATGKQMISPTTGLPLTEEVPLPYIPVNKVKMLLKRIFGGYEWKINSCKQELNSMCVCGTLTIVNPITGQRQSNDGVGAAPIQMDAGASAGDLSKIKNNAIMIGAPAANSYAFKNAAEQFGDIFGGNIYDKDSSAYQQTFDEKTRQQSYKAEPKK